MMSTVQLGVVIVSWNVRELLARCLQALLSDLTASSLTARIVVVDNASRDGSPDMVRVQFPQVELIARSDNLGFARGNNLGLRALGFEALGAAPQVEHALLLNPDTEVQPGAIKTLLDVLTAHPKAALITSRLAYGDGAFQHSAFRFPGLAQLYIDLFPVPGRLYESRLNGRYPRAWYAREQPFDIDTPLGAVMLLRGAAMRQVGLFDENFALYCEEIDWAARFKEAGWRNLCAPAARIVHHAGRSTTQVKTESFVKLWTSRYQLHRKHPKFAPLTPARLIVMQGMRRRLRGAAPEMRAACEQIMRVWSQ